MRAIGDGDFVIFNHGGHGGHLGAGTPISKLQHCPNLRTLSLKKFNVYLPIFTGAPELKSTTREKQKRLRIYNNDHSPNMVTTCCLIRVSLFDVFELKFREL
ncbi:hypothetical protein TNCV_4270171 [Trichonephila clavipes]|nr:hypothetical protein TNCV_4270171 [Trichonephila clavipes]